MKTIAFALLTVALAAPAMAADKQEAPKPKPHLICKRDQDTGTRVSGRICKTAEAWAASGVDEDNGKLDTINRQATTLNVGGLPNPPGSGPH
ncbi:MAG: hypothetical protein JWO81_901 [Alphaproteobacteria bacterium]|nr:hypothetical protein [Alphaproteobacteria bacterium]